MKKKIAFYISFSIVGFILLAFLSSFFFFPTLFNDLLYQHNIPEEYNLSETRKPLIGCLIEVSEDHNLCYNKEARTFQKVDFLDEYTNIDKYEEGFVLLEPNGEILKEYEVDIEDVFTKWYVDIKANEKGFSTDIEGIIHLDLYNLVQWRILQFRRGDIQEEVVGDELDKYVRNSSYIIMTPMRYSDLQFVCEIKSEDCNFWKSFKEIPFNIIKSANNDENWDFNDMNMNWSRLVMTSVGLSSIDTENPENEEYISEYEEFKQGFREYYGEVSDEEFEFIGQYLPLDFSYLWSSFFKGWDDVNKTHYYKLLDLYCAKEECLEIKLNILYDEI